MLKITAPPLKIQGIKTKLVPFIHESIDWVGEGKWIEPFMGSGVVAFNLRPDRALLTDINPHLIRFYSDIQSGAVTPLKVRQHLENEGSALLKHGREHYYEVRKRFNEAANSLDFLFLNRACFNGVMRFNSKGGFNVPFCNKDNRFQAAYVTRIVNQVSWVASIIAEGSYEFRVCDWTEAVREAGEGDFIYADPPYNARHTDYFTTWDDATSDSLADALKGSSSGFALSTWLSNKYRHNDWVEDMFSGYPTLTREHFYHVGSKETLRNSMTEALVVKHGHVRSTPNEPARHEPSADLLSAL